MGDRPHDVQELSDEETTVYEAVAALAVEGRPAHLVDIAQMTDRPEEDVRHCLETLVASGWLRPRADGYLLGPHDFEVER
jgi:DNA-binding IclR family transcriptional regulator